MAFPRWRGGAAAIAQVNTWTFGGTWIVGETITVVVGSKSWQYAVTSATIATFLPLLEAAYAALDADEYPEMAEMTADSTSTTFVLTANTKGVPFTATISTNSASGTINGSSLSTGTATVANAGPNVFSTAKNWSTGAVPTNGDTMDLSSVTEWPILYDLEHPATNSNTFAMVYSGTTPVGLPHLNANSTTYPEYRPQHLKLPATTVDVGLGNSNGGSSTGPAGRFKVDFSSGTGTLIIRDADSGDYADLETVQAKGTMTLTVLRGSVGVAIHPDESATVTTLQIGSQGNPASDARVRLGSGCAVTTVTKYGGQLVINNPASLTLTQELGETTLNGTGAPSQLNVKGGVVYYNTTGTLGGNTLVIAQNGGLLDFTRDPRAKAVTNPIEVFGGFPGVADDNKVVSSLVVDYNQTGIPGLGVNIRVTRGTPS